jgi:hypothetical protein
MRQAAPHFVAFLVTAALLVGCGKKPDRHEQTRAREAMSYSQILNFQKTHSASEEWWNVLEEIGKPFSTEVEEALTLGKGQPILLVAELTDLSKSGDEIIAHFSERVGFSNLLLRLSISPETLSQIKSQLPKDERFMALFVVAFHPESVSKPIFKAKAKGFDDGYTEIQIDAPAAVIVTGQCTALEYLGPDGISFDDYISMKNQP